MDSACCRLGKGAYFILTCGNHLEQFVSHLNNRTPRTIIPRSLLASATGHDQTNDDSHDRNFNSSSYNHYRYHRGKYEQKRTRSQKNREKHHQSSAQDEPSPISDVAMSHYQRLNIQPGADSNTIKSAYYSLSKIYHPDTASLDDTTAAEQFRLITESYNVLSDPTQRSEYDKRLDVGPISNYDSEIFRQSADSSQESDNIYRARNAEMLFRSKQEAALEREKLLNPRKFRAGTFKDSSPNLSVEERQEEIDRLKRRIESLGMRSGPSTGDDFYRTHLYNAIHRRHSGLVNTQLFENLSGRKSDESGAIAILVGFGIIAFVGLTIFNLLVDYDAGAYLDSKLVALQSKPEEPEGELKSTEGSAMSTRK